MNSIKSIRLSAFYYDKLLAKNLLSFLTYASGVLMEHMAITTPFQLMLFGDIVFSSGHVISAALAVASMLLCPVCFVLSIQRFHCGFHSRDGLVMFDGIF